MSRRRVVKFLLDGAPVEARDRAQPAGNRGPGPPLGLQVAGEALDIRAADTEQAQVMPLAPVREMAQIQRVRLVVRPVHPARSAP